MDLAAAIEDSPEQTEEEPLDPVSEIQRLEEIRDNSSVEAESKFRIP